ncbi:MAG: 2-hydroxyacyl-CoA dehydratase, partial [Dehalococcoidales bacterium]|nr:2-hydroxyacyl-CoA dehydratase [Dehalococcoidales bacterium]
AKIVGYVPNGYMPEELVWAGGAIPVGLIHGGDHEAIMASEAYLFRLLDSYCRSQIGYRALGKEPLYQLPDLLVVPITDRNVTAIADSWELSTKVAVFKYGVPRYKGIKHALDYYIGGLNLLKQKLENLTGIEIKNDKLKEELELSNKINRLLETISFARKSQPPGISGKDFFRLNHAGYYADRNVLLSALESISQEITEGKYVQKPGVRIMLVGSTIAEGDNNLVDLLEQAGGNIVIEDFSEGIRPYQQMIETDGDLLRNIAESAMEKRVPPALFHNVMKERFDYFFKLIKDFKVDGVIWYSMMYRDSYDREGLFFSRILDKEAGIPLLKINTDYDTAETEQMRTKIETFIEIVKQGR